MVCHDLDTILQAFEAQYEQIVCIHDAALSRTGWLPKEEMPSLAIEVSEEAKSIQTVMHLWDWMLAHQLTRRALVIAVGGGVITDMVGFAAATYKRGVHYINIPTTLLAMVDASSGGKTGVNYQGIKNAIGLFAPPIDTIICPTWLTTLPSRQFLSGFGEMLKMGLIHSPSLWHALLRYNLERMDIPSLTPLIEACIAAKEAIVSADPNEQGLRKTLNFGHTFGHALEIVGGMPHGYAVVYGMIAELYLSVTRLACPREPLQQLTSLMLTAYGKPQCKCAERDRLIALMQQDKKNERTAQINCTLLQSVGSPLINQVISPEEASEALEYLFSL